MKKIHIVSSTLIDAALAATVFAFDALSDFKTAVNKMLPQVAKAFEKEDLKYFESTSTPDFTYVMADGTKMEKKAAMGQMKQMFASADHIKAKLGASKHMVKGTTAACDVEGHYSMTMKTPDGKSHKMTTSEWTRATFRKVGAKWMMSQMKETKPSQMMMDGKPFDPSKMGGG